ncbi:hypothetical protein SRHO_G00290660 [Serrasalmus rhombeus]
MLRHKWCSRATCRKKIAKAATTFIGIFLVAGSNGKHYFSSAETTVALYFDSCKEKVGQSMESSSLHLKMAMNFVCA